MMFKVYQFEIDNSIMTLPMSWVENNWAPYSVSARLFIKTNKRPPANWLKFKVKALDNKTYDTYDAALKAEEILLQKTDLDTSEYETCKMQGKKKPKKRKKMNVLLKASASDDDEEDELPLAPLRDITNEINVNTEVDKLGNVNDIMQQSEVILNNDLLQMQAPEVIEEIVPYENIDANIALQPSEIILSSDSVQVQNSQLTSEFENMISYSQITETTNHVSSGQRDDDNIQVLQYDTDIIRNIIREELQIFKKQIDEQFNDLRRLFQEKENTPPSKRAKYIEFEETQKFPLKTKGELEMFDECIKNSSGLQQAFISRIHN